MGALGAYHKCIREAGKGCEIKDVMYRPHARGSVEEWVSTLERRK